MNAQHPSPSAHSAAAVALSTTPRAPIIAFIGGGNMASAIIGGLRSSGTAAADILVLEPWAPQRDKLLQDFGISAHAEAGDWLQPAAVAVWATKPQVFAEAAQPCAPWLGQALHLSVMAGIRSDAIARAMGTQRVARAMPNTPALIGRGIAGLYARAEVTAPERDQISTLLAPTGAVVWVAQESDLDAVTALSGSGPAYVFYFLEAMIATAERMGLSAEQGKQLALATFAGATELAQRSDDSPAVLRERVTSKGGTTYAALTHLAANGVAEHFGAAMDAARERARTLGDEFGS